jgi:hypothetical protein
MLERSASKFNFDVSIPSYLTEPSVGMHLRSDSVKELCQIISPFSFRPKD